MVRHVGSDKTARRNKSNPPRELPESSDRTMNDARTEERVPPPFLNRAGAEPSAKRRTVRKGTRSCWECKRRKIRCIFPSPDDTACIGCQHRHTPCVRQDMPEDPSAARKGSRNLGERVARVEDFIKGLTANRDACETGKTGRELQPEARSEDAATTFIRFPLTPAEVGNRPGHPQSSRE
jgi:hypothetical protein